MAAAMCAAGMAAAMLATARPRVRSSQHTTAFVGGPGGRPSAHAGLLQRGAAEGAAAPEVAGASTPSVAGAGAVAALALLAAGARRSRAGRAAKGSAVAQTRGSRLVAHDGSSWGFTGYGPTTKLNNPIGGLPTVTLSNGVDEATVYPYGACVTSYKTGDVEWLAVRPDAKLDGSKPISGGLPHCFPQFGPGAIQQHGFARNMNWRLLEEPSDNGICIMELSDSEETRKIWPHKFLAEYRVQLQEGALTTTFKVQNTGDKEWTFTTALHSYYSTSSVSTCKIQGKFKGASKIDKTEKPPKATKGESDTVKIAKFTEEIYENVLPGTVTLHDPSKGDLDIVTYGGWKDVVVWNPFGDEAMGADFFVCVESAALTPVKLAPKQVWEATLVLIPKKQMR